MGVEIEQLRYQTIHCSNIILYPFQSARAFGCVQDILQCRKICALDQNVKRSQMTNSQLLIVSSKKRIRAAGLLQYLDVPVECDQHFLSIF